MTSKANTNKRVSLLVGADVVDYYKQRANDLEVSSSALMRLALKQFMEVTGGEGKNKEDKINFDGQIDLLK